MGLAGSNSPPAPTASSLRWTYAGRPPAKPAQHDDTPAPNPTAPPATGPPHCGKRHESPGRGGVDAPFIYFAYWVGQPDRGGAVMSWGSDGVTSRKHPVGVRGTLGRSSGRLGAWPDDQSSRAAHKTKENRAPSPPAARNGLVEDGARVPEPPRERNRSSTTVSKDGSDMEQSTRASSDAHGTPGSSGENITPLSTDDTSGGVGERYVDPTEHRPGDCCEFCDTATFNADPTTCPGWLKHRTRQLYRVEGWESYGAWEMISSAQNSVREAEDRMSALKRRFPNRPMRITAETTSYMVVATAPGSFTASL